jgi:hypothetical protein
MKITDRIFRFVGNRARGKDSICRVRVFAHEGKVTTVLTDLDELHTGLGITNGVEKILGALIEEGTIPDYSDVIEHYDRSSGPALEVVTFNSAGRPSWDNISVGVAAAILGCDESELLVRTADIPRLREAIERARNELDPFLDSPMPDSKEVALRRIAIDKNRISKAQVAELVEAGSGERELLRLIKSDLSILGEFYAKDDEYIVLSEFPIGGGFVDFAIFTGRSRMEIILIEIKGADFGIVNADSYGKFASKIEEATDQIRERLTVAYEDYQGFKKHAHEIRAAAETGSKLYGALLGPEIPLEVDPRKDVEFRCVVIGGRTRDDLSESRKRNAYERHFRPSIKIESWDSWLRKLSRR